MELLTTADAAAKLGVTARRVIALIKDGRLPARKVGRDYIINEKDLKLVQHRKPGRPAKNKPPRSRQT
ncbi:MAG: helix-turn-helix domain-containing protein [Blastocatellia bacterium]